MWVVWLLVIVVVLLAIGFGIFTFVLHVDPRHKHRMRCMYVKDYERRMQPESTFRVVEKLNEQSSDRLFSVSLYGTHEKYINGVKALAQQCRQEFPDWAFRVYLHDQSRQWIDPLVNLGCEVVLVADAYVKPGNSSGAFWRYLPACEPVTFFCLDVDEAMPPKLITALRFWYPRRQGGQLRPSEFRVSRNRV